MKKSFMTGSAILFLLLLPAALYFVKAGLGGEQKKSPNGAFRHNDAEDLLRRRIDELEAAYAADCRKLLSAFQTELEKRIALYFAEADNGAAQVMERLCSISVSMKLCFKAAKDKMLGTGELLTAYTHMMDAPVIRPCLRANAAASDMLQDLRLRLQENYSAYITGLAAFGSAGDTDMILPSKDIEKLRRSLERFNGSVRQASSEKVIAGIGAAFELAFIRISCRSVAKLFAKPAAKICSALGLAGICAAADGPILLGDAVGAAVALGGAAWTVRDVYEVTCVVPSELNAELRQGIASAKSALLAESQDLAQQMVRTFIASGGSVSRELKAQLE